MHCSDLGYLCFRQVRSLLRIGACPLNQEAAVSRVSSIGRNIVYVGIDAPNLPLAPREHGLGLRHNTSQRDMTGQRHRDTAWKDRQSNEAPAHRGVGLPHDRSPSVLAIRRPLTRLTMCRRSPRFLRFRRMLCCVEVFLKVWHHFDASVLLEHPDQRVVTPPATFGPRINLDGAVETVDVRP